jgi:acyl-ACP thioesterase
VDADGADGAPDPRALDAALVPRPERGRVFEAGWLVRLGDVSARGRLRFDATARHLQDLSSDDTADAALPDGDAWVVRRTVIEVHRFPTYREHLAMATWCGGTGGHWAERRTSIVGERGGHVEAAALWVHLDPERGRPRRLPPSFLELYGDAAGGRRVSARLSHEPEPPPGTASMPWPLRVTDFDVLDHVNNAVYWVPVEEALAVRRDLRAPLRAEVEHRAALERDADARVAVADLGPEGLDLWITDGERVAATARVRSLPG